MKVKLLAVVSSSVLGVSLLAGVGTYALFSSSASNSNNTFTAGTVSLAVPRGGGEAFNGPIFYGSSDDPTGIHPYDQNTGNAQSGESIGGWAPGDTVSRLLNVQNTGTLDAKLMKIKAELTSIIDASGTPLDPSSQAYQDFMNNMQITVFTPDNTQIFNGTLQQLLGGYQVLASNPILSSGSTNYNLTFTAKMGSSAGNDIQGVKSVFGFTLYAEQARNNGNNNTLFKGSVTSGMPSQWDGYYASHMDFLTNVPANAQVLTAANQNGTDPTAVYYTYGSGQVLMTGQTLEFYYNSLDWATTEWHNIVDHFVDHSAHTLILWDNVGWGGNAQAEQYVEQKAGNNQLVSNLTSGLPANLSSYKTIVIDGVQNMNFANNLNSVMSQINQWVQNGGTLIFDAASQDGMPQLTGPEGINVHWNPALTNYKIGDVQ